MASMIDAGTRCGTNSLSVSAETLRLVAVPASGSGRLMFAPGCRTLTITSPSSSDTIEADTNQPIVLSPIRPTAALSPMCAIPTTRVENTSGAMIILISRKKTVVMREM